MGNCITDKDLVPLELETKPEAEEKVTQKYNIYEACIKKVISFLLRSTTSKNIMIKPSIKNKKEDLGLFKGLSSK